MNAPRWLPSAERLAASLLAIAAITILAFALLATFELDREADLHRDVIAGLQVKDSLEALRMQVTDLVHAARLAALTDERAAVQAIERRAVEVDAELAYLAQHPSRVDTPEFEELARGARLLAINARSVAGTRQARGTAGARAALAEVERLAEATGAAMEHVLDTQRDRINDRALAQIRIGETLRAYVAWLLAGSAVVLVGLFGFYLWVRARERLAAARIERLAHYDVVTGLPNRALIADRLEQEIARAQRTERAFALLMFDLDGFKQVNDTWGHAAGDAVLKMVGRRSRESVRASDTVGRVGGDEFLAILPETTRAGALQVAEKLREALGQPYLLGGPVANLGASVGVSFYGEHGADAESLQRAADAALYEAKRRGKNRVMEAPVALQRSPAM